MDEAVKKTFQRILDQALHSAASVTCSKAEYVQGLEMMCAGLGIVIRVAVATEEITAGLRRYRR